VLYRLDHRARNVEEFSAIDQVFQGVQVGQHGWYLEGDTGSRDYRRQLARGEETSICVGLAAIAGRVISFGGRRLLGIIRIVLQLVRYQRLQGKRQGVHRDLRGGSRIGFEFGISIGLN